MKKRYSTKPPRAAMQRPVGYPIDSEFYGTMLVGETVYVDGEEPDYTQEFTGILDPDGNPIFRYYEKFPIGFHHKNTEDYYE